MPHQAPKPTPLSEANTTKQLSFLSDIVENNITQVRSYLENGMNPNVEKKRLSAIELAVRTDNYEMVKLLLEYGANPLEKMGDTYLDMSVTAFSSSLEDSRILKLMFEYGANAQNINNFSAFSGAASKNREENFNFLLENSFDVNATIRQKDSILSFCAYDPSRVKMTNLLLIHGADVNAQTDQNVTALHNAITQGNSENVTLLLKYGADVNHQDYQGNNAVAKAVKFDNAEILKILIKYDADITSKLYKKVTPLVVAAVLDNYRVAQVLVDSMNVKDGGYILIAYKYGDSKMFNFLLDNGFRENSIKLGKSYINFYLVNDRDEELQEYLSIYGFDGFELRYISIKSRARLSKIFDKLLVKNSFNDKQKLSIAKNFQYVRDNQRAYKWMMDISAEKVDAKVKCNLSTNAGKVLIKACKKYAQQLQEKHLDKNLSFIYLVLKEYDKSIQASKRSLKKDKLPFVYSNMGHVYLIKGDKKRAYQAYKNYFVKLKSTTALIYMKEDFNVLKLAYPSRSAEFTEAYEYSKKIDREVMKKYLKSKR